MYKKRVGHLLGLVLFVTLFAGCASLKVVETWHKPAIQQHKKIMIVGIGNDESKRKLFEDIVVDELRRNHVVAVASHTILPDLDKTDRGGIISAVHAAGCDGVLTTRVVTTGNNAVSQKDVSGTIGYIYGVAPMTTRGNFLKANLQSNLYSTKTEELIWSATVKTFDGEREAKVSREMGKFFFEALRKDGLL